MRLQLSKHGNIEEALARHPRLESSWHQRRLKNQSNTGTFAQRHADAWKLVHCPRFFAIGQNAGYLVFFMPRLEENQVSQRFWLPLLILPLLYCRFLPCSYKRSTKKVSPWLQLLRWSLYLGGRHIPSVATLLVQPNREVELTLVTLCDSLERIVKDAHASVLSDRINAFDQVHINSFLYQPHTIGRPRVLRLS